jgi:hypothetical protein
MYSFGQNATSESKAEVVCNKERLNPVFVIKTRLSMQVLKSNQNLNFYLRAIKLQKTKPCWLPALPSLQKCAFLRLLLISQQHVHSFFQGWCLELDAPLLCHHKVRRPTIGAEKKDQRRSRAAHVGPENGIMVV